MSSKPDWPGIFARQQEEWSNIALSDEHRERQLAILMKQVYVYRTHPDCAGSEAFSPGVNCEKPIVDVVFVFIEHPGKVQPRWLSLFEDMIEGRRLAYAIVYLLPYSSRRKLDEASASFAIFSTFAIKRIALLNPRVVAFVGGKAFQAVKNIAKPSGKGEEEMLFANKKIRITKLPHPIGLDSEGKFFRESIPKEMTKQLDELAKLAAFRGKRKAEEVLMEASKACDPEKKRKAATKSPIPRVRGQTDLSAFFKAKSC